MSKIADETISHIVSGKVGYQCSVSMQIQVLLSGVVFFFESGFAIVDNSNLCNTCVLRDSEHLGVLGSIKRLLQGLVCDDAFSFTCLLV